MKLSEVTIGFNKAPKLFQPEEAEKQAEILNSDPDDDWEYRVKHDPKGTGYSLIEIYDEDGEFVGHV